MSPVTYLHHTKPEKCRALFQSSHSASHVTGRSEKTGMACRGYPRRFLRLADAQAPSYLSHGVPLSCHAPGMPSSWHAPGMVCRHTSGSRRWSQWECRCLCRRRRRGTLMWSWVRPGRSRCCTTHPAAERERMGEPRRRRSLAVQPGPTHTRGTPKVHRQGWAVRLLRALERQNRPRSNLHPLPT